jgi:outer membrane protein assembly factor BamB
LVVVPGGGPTGNNKTTLLAFDRESGELRWQGGNQMISYGSPILATIAGRRQILYVAESMIMGFDPKTGDVLWDHPRPGDSTSAANCSQPTVISANRIVTSKGYPDGGGEVIELTVDGDRLKAKSIWSDHRVLKTKLTSPVIYNGHSYAISNGFLECADLSNGKRVWKRRGRFGHGQILLVEDKLLVHSESGVLYLVAADPTGYRELGSFKTIDGVCWNTLCLYGSRLLLRSELEAACYELPVIQPDPSDPST